MGVDQPLPIEKFIYRQPIALAGLVQADQAVADRRDNFGFAPDDPTHGVFWWKAFDG